MLQSIDSIGDDGGVKLDDEATQRGQLIALRAGINSNYALVLLKRKEYAEAAAKARDALKADPGHAKALFRCGTANAHMGLLDEGKRVLSQRR